MVFVFLEGYASGVPSYTTCPDANFLPEAAVVVLAVMPIWQQGRTEPIPSPHVDEMRRLAHSLVSDVTEIALAVGRHW